jgi:DNA-directed RNA polymerase specialized sigma24 family protein
MYPGWRFTLSRLMKKIVLLYHDIEKKSIDETAVLLGVSSSNARTRLSRARDAYRHAVERVTAGKRP